MSNRVSKVNPQDMVLEGGSQPECLDLFLSSTAVPPVGVQAHCVQTSRVATITLQTSEKMEQIAQGHQLTRSHTLRAMMTHALIHTLQTEVYAKERGEGGGERGWRLRSSEDLSDSYEGWSGDPERLATGQTDGRHRSTERPPDRSWGDTRRV